MISKPFFFFMTFFLLMHEKKASQISDRLFIKFITKDSSSPASSFAFFPQQALVNKQQFAMTDWLNNVGLLCTHNTTKSDEELFSTLAEAYCQTFFLFVRTICPQEIAGSRGNVYCRLTISSLLTKLSL